mgnify:CR=1 FL=1
MDFVDNITLLKKSKLDLQKYTDKLVEIMAAAGLWLKGV